jgi:hypothetical protein
VDGVVCERSSLALQGGCGIRLRCSLTKICGQKPGTYIVLARATLAGNSVDSPARLLTITAGKERGY